MKRAFRSDAGKVRLTPNGGLEVEAVLTRPGVFTYYTETGKPVREYRPPEEVFNESALAQIANLPVTNLHHGKITAENWRQFAAGHVASPPRREGDTLVATLWLQDAQALADVRAGRSEISCGTEWSIDWTPGVTPEGEAYDCIQRTPRYNHVAIVPRARLGSDMRLRLDGAGNQIDPEGCMKIKINGKDYEGESAVQAAVDALGTERSQLQARFDAAQAELATARTERSQLQARFDAAQTPEAINALVAARSALVTTAAHFLPELRCDGLSDADVRRQVVGKAYPTLKLDGKDDAYVSTLFDAARATAATAQATANATQARVVEAPPAAGTSPATLHQDGDDLETLERKRREQSQNAYKKPLARSVAR